MPPRPKTPPSRSSHRRAFDRLRIGVSAGLVLLGVIVLSGSAGADADRKEAVETAARREIASLPRSARVEALVEHGAPQLVATLLVSNEDEPARVGVLFELAPGWHIYWRNPGDTGVASQIEFSVDDHAVGPLAWPAPETFREADDLFTTYGYAHEVLLAAPIVRAEATRSSAESIGRPRAAGSAPGAREVRADVEVLVCRTECIPERFALKSALAARTSDADRSEIGALFDELAAHTPQPAAQLGWSARARWSEESPAVDATGSIELVVDPCASPDAADCDDPAEKSPELRFLPYESDRFEFAASRSAEGGEANPPSSSRALSLRLSATRLERGDDRLHGLVAFENARGELVHAEVDLPIDSSTREAVLPTTAPSGDSAANGSLAWIHVLLLAFVGGLILNGMPCVLPVLAIKVVSVAGLAERDANEVRLHGLAYAAGVLGSMLFLATLVVGLRSAGHAVGWGFQFQEPLFVAAIAALVVAFAMNLFGVFEIELGQGRLAVVGQDATGLSRSMFEGLLAVVLATPCTAPFLGTAVGFAFASSAAAIVAIFLAIGLGLASPFLLVSFFPRLARFVPRSGPWMLKLRAGLGFCLLATVIWLLWIVGQSGGADAVVALTAALLFLSFLLWTFGQLQPMRSIWLARASAIAIALVCFASFNLIEFERADASNALDRGAASEAAFEPYSEAAVREALARGVPAFVVFTADWCLTCKVNERTVLDRPAVREALARGGYALFKADWTRRDESIRARLAAFGRAGVPLYLVYDPAKPDQPRVLSELLTKEAVLAALADSARATTDRI